MFVRLCAFADFVSFPPSIFVSVKEERREGHTDRRGEKRRDEKVRKIRGSARIDRRRGNQFSETMRSRARFRSHANRITLSLSSPLHSYPIPSYVLRTSVEIFFGREEPIAGAAALYIIYNSFAWRTTVAYARRNATEKRFVSFARADRVSQVKDPCRDRRFAERS